MEFGKKLIIGAIGTMALATVGMHTVYKQFEHTPNPVREVLRWPHNNKWDTIDQLTDESTSFQLQSVSGRITSKRSLETSNYTIPSHGGRRYYLSRRDAITFIELDNEQRYSYVGDFFAGIDDEVTLDFMTHDEFIRLQNFYRGIQQVSKTSGWPWVARLYDPLAPFPRIRSYENILPTRIPGIDGVIEDYHIDGFRITSQE